MADAKGLPVDAVARYFVERAKKLDEKRGGESAVPARLDITPILRKSACCAIKESTTPSTESQDKLVRSVCMLAAHKANRALAGQGCQCSVILKQSRHFLGTVYASPDANEATIQRIADEHPFKKAGLKAGGVAVLAGFDRAYRSPDLARLMHGYCTEKEIDVLFLTIGRYDLDNALTGDLLLAGVQDPAFVGADGLSDEAAAAAVLAAHRAASVDAARGLAEPRDRKASAFRRSSTVLAAPVNPLADVLTQAAVITSACKSCACVVNALVQVKPWMVAKPKFQALTGPNNAHVAAGEALKELVYDVCVCEDKHGV